MIEPTAARPRDLVHEVSNFLTICRTTGRLAAEGRGKVEAAEALEEILERAEELCHWIEAARPGLLRVTPTAGVESGSTVPQAPAPGSTR